MSKLRKNIPQEEFIDLYINKNYSITELQRYYKVDQSTIYTRIKRWNLYKTDEQKHIAKTNCRKNTSQKLYGDPNYNNRQQAELTCIERYNVSNVHKSNNIQNKAKLTCLKRYGSSTYNNMEKNRQTKLERYGDPNYNNRGQAKLTCLKRYGVDNIFKDKERQKHFKSKEYDTRRKNNTLNTSSIEENIYLQLCNKYKHIIRQYKISNMWFDFKIDNLLIEINGMYYHNYRPFNNSKEHIEEYNSMKAKNKQLATIADTWRYRDTRKLKYCKENNLNLLVIYLYRIPDNIIDIIENNKTGINVII